jgi:hypothetical protein
MANLAKPALEVCSRSSSSQTKEESAMMDSKASNSVYDLNNRATCDIIEGKYSDALVKMTFAVRDLKYALRGPPNEHVVAGAGHDSYNPFAAQEAEMDTIACLPFTETEELRSSDAAGSFSTIREDGLLDIFNCTFRLNSRGQPKAELSSSSASLASKVVLYNLGLCYHLEAIRTNDCQKLQVALECYEMAVEVVEQYSGGAYQKESLQVLLALLVSFIGGKFLLPQSFLPLSHHVYRKLLLISEQHGPHLLSPGRPAKSIPPCPGNQNGAVLGHFGFATAHGSRILGYL